MGIDRVYDRARISGEIIDLPEVLEVEKEFWRGDKLGNSTPFYTAKENLIFSFFF